MLHTLTANKALKNNKTDQNKNHDMAASSLIFPLAALLHKAPRPSPSLSKGRTARQVERNPSIPLPPPLLTPPLPPLVPRHHISSAFAASRKKNPSTPAARQSTPQVSPRIKPQAAPRHRRVPLAGSGEDRASSSSPSSGDGGASAGKPPLGTAGPAPPSPSSLWITERVDGGGNTLAGSAYRPFTSSSLLTVLMHTTQPMFTGKMKLYTVGVKLCFSLTNH